MLLSSASNWTRISLIVGLISLVTACSSDDDENEPGQIKFYNASVDSPAIFLTLDEDLDDDPDDEFENTFSGISFGRASSATDVPSASYFYELAWQEEDGTQRNDLTLLSEGTLQISDETLTFVVMSGSVIAPDVQVYTIPVIDTEDDIDNDTLNLQILNAHNDYASLDVYISETNETFNEAQFLGTANQGQWTENVKLDEDDYIFYLTLPGEDNVLFESTELAYLFNTQYFLAIRENVGGSDNPFALDNMTFSGSQSASPEDALARVRFYNGVHNHPSLPDYSGAVSLDIEEVSSATNVLALTLSQSSISESYSVEADDYRLTLVDGVNEVDYIENQLFSVPVNTARTVFFYVDEVYVDDDGDGDFDEDGDGKIDEIKANITSVVVEDDTRESAFDRAVSIVNLADNEDFSSVSVYFVETDETIETADARRNVVVGQSSNIVLRNNTYDVFAVATIEGQETILDSVVLTLDEEHVAKFLLIEHNITSSSGYSITTLDQ